MTRTAGRPRLRASFAVLAATAVAVRGRARLAGFLALMLASGLTDGVGLLLLVPVLDGLGADGRATLRLPGGLSWTGPLAVLLAGVVALVAARALLQRAVDTASARLRLEVVDRLRLAALDAVLHARWSFFLTRRRSDLVQAVVTDAARVSVALDQAVAVLGSAVLLVVSVAVAALLSPGVTGLAVLAGVVLLAAAVPGLRGAAALGQGLGDRQRDFAATASDALESLRLVRAHDAAGPWVRALHRDAASLRAAVLAFVRRAATTRARVQVGSALGAAAVVLASLRLGVPQSSVLVLVLVMARMLGSASGLLRSAQVLANMLPAVDDVAGLTADAAAAREQTPAGDLPAPAEGAAPAEGGAAPPGLALEAVSFRYPLGDRHAVVDVDLSVPAGSITALAGPSGSGKSTLVDLALGLLAPDTGRVLVDGGPLDASTLRAWRERVAYVPQDVALVPGTLRDNLTWTLPAGRHVDDAACWAVLEEAAADFAARLPQGLDTPMGDRGVRLSGGERQRVALARALLRRPAFLVLDEATSALDGVTEAHVQARLRALRGATTVLLVAHRASTVAVADHVVLVDAGRVVEQGPFDELLGGPGALGSLLGSGLA